MSTSKAAEITLTWTGKTWKVESTAEPTQLKKGASFTVPIPLDAFNSAPAETGTKILFPKGTVLYLPLNPIKDEIALYQRCAAKKPKLRRTPANKELLPIILDDDLVIRISSERLLDARCRYAGSTSEEFTSLNDAAQTALKNWTDRETAAIGVFKEVRFVHDAQLLMIDLKRDEVLHGKPLPENSTKDEGPGLFNELD